MTQRKIGPLVIDATVSMRHLRVERDRERKWKQRIDKKSEKREREKKRRIGNRFIFQFSDANGKNWNDFVLITQTREISMT